MICKIGAAGESDLTTDRPNQDQQAELRAGNTDQADLKAEEDLDTIKEHDELACPPDFRRLYER